MEFIKNVWDAIREFYMNVWDWIHKGWDAYGPEVLVAAVIITLVVIVGIERRRK